MRLSWRFPWCAWDGRDQFIEHGKVDDLRAKYGLTAESAMERVRVHLKQAVGSRS